MNVKAWKFVGAVGGTLAWMAFADLSVSELLGGEPWLFGWGCMAVGLALMVAGLFGALRAGEATKCATQSTRRVRGIAYRNGNITRLPMTDMICQNGECTTIIRHGA